jgi:hypothetical protein
MTHWCQNTLFSKNHLWGGSNNALGIVEKLLVFDWAALYG